jgi:hypothetical protein
MIRNARKRTTFIFDLIRSYRYERCSFQANSSIEEATTARKQTTAGTQTTTRPPGMLETPLTGETSTAVGKADTAEILATEGAPGKKQH